jgi:SAM-dependent methyltransferase/uncharacterized protein YbaR (Trm112 family)
VSDRLLDHVVCLRCARGLRVGAHAIVCEGCGQDYPRVGSIPVLLPQPDAHVALWRQQLALVVAQSQSTLEGLEAEAGRSGILPETGARLRALAQGLRDQTTDTVDVLGPALGGPALAAEGVRLPRGAVEHVHFLYRDWGWSGDAPTENQQALDAIRNVLSDNCLGRTLVLGAGACRLAYDLHRLCGATETAVVDIDPFLFVVAEAVVRGRSVRLIESTANVHETMQIAASLSLAAPAGPLDPERFHFFFANGLGPPFAEGTFDTIFTPWFIDQVPPDLPAFLATLNRLLRPGGRWLNQGPLLYPPEAPISRRFSREEVFALAARAGFRVGKWSSESRPHLVSPLTGRGRVERILTFEALQVASPNR